jgi:uncharacterized protein
MICPRCGGNLTERRFGAVAVDGCSACGGLWLDANELGQIARDPSTGLMDVERAFQPAVSAEAGAGTMACPKCGAALYRFEFPHTPGVPLDACPACKGVWMDDGELQQIAERLAEARKKTASVSPNAAMEQSQQEAQRQQARVATAFLLSSPCASCGTTNPATAVVCWACGKPLKTRSALHLCPRCDQPMQEMQPGDAPTRVDACLSCKGVWFGAGELSVFLSAGLQEVQRVRQAIGDGLGAYVDRNVYEHNLIRCPGCHHGMERQSLGGQSDVMIDVCPYCKGVWLDAGELVAAYNFFKTGGVPGAARSSDAWGAAL